MSPENFNQRVRDKIQQERLGRSTRVCAALSTVWGKSQRAVIVSETAVPVDDKPGIPITFTASAIVLRASTNPEDYHIRVDEFHSEALKPGEELQVDRGTGGTTMQVHLRGTQETTLTQIAVPGGIHLSEPNAA